MSQSDSNKLHDSLKDALVLFNQQKWYEAHDAFTSGYPNKLPTKSN